MIEPAVGRAENFWAIAKLISPFDDAATLCKGRGNAKYCRGALVIEAHVRVLRKFATSRSKSVHTLHSKTVLHGN